jgi:hypothetical protein
MSSIGLKSEVSSSEGNRIDVNWEFASLRVNKGVPQSGQKMRVARPPLLARTAYVFGVPLISRSAVMTTMPDAKGAPLDSWQSLQWQLIMAMGSRAPV